MNNQDGSVIRTVLGDRSFAPGDILEVQESHFKPEKPHYKKVKVSIWSTATNLIVADEWGNQWCIHEVHKIKSA